MDIPTLHNILLHTFSTDNDARKAAEDAVKNLHTSRGSIVLLVQLIMSEEIQREIRQAGAISLKNMVQKHWIHQGIQGEEYFVFPDVEKDEYRRYIIEGLFGSNDNSIQALLVESVSIIAREDFPEKWPHLIEQICLTIQSGQAHRIIHALLALRKLVKIFEFKPSHQRETLNQIVVATFPLLQTMFQQLIGNPSIEAGYMIHLILKIFWSCVQCALPPFLTIEIINKWLEFFQLILKKELPEPKNKINENIKNPWWKSKKWTLQILCRFYNVYGNPKHSNASHDFCTFFRNQVAPYLLVGVLEILNLRPQNRYCPDRIIQLGIMYLQEAITSASAYKQLQPHLDFVLFQVIHPLFLLKSNDFEMYLNDPEEYIRRSNDILGEYLNPVCAAENLLLELCTKRGKDCLDKILNFYNNLLIKIPKNEIEWIEKEAAIHALCALDSFLIVSHCIEIEKILFLHILPLFQNQRGYIRLRAIKILSRNYMTKLNFSDNTINEILKNILNCLNDIDLIVRIEAAKSFRNIVLYKNSTIVIDTLRPLLPKIINQFFIIMDEMGYGDEIILSLEQLIDSFCDEMGPYAIELVLHLTKRFKFSIENKNEECFTAASCLDAINTILMSIYNQPNLFEPLIDILLPILHLILNSNNYFDYIESALDIVKSISYYNCSKILLLFPSIFRGVDYWGREYMQQLIIVLYSIIGRDSNGFLSAILQINLPNGNIKKIRYIELVYNLIRKLLLKENSDEDEIYGGCCMIQCILDNCVDIDIFLLPILQLISYRFSFISLYDEKIKTYLYSVILSSLYYNSILTIKILENLNILNPILLSIGKNADIRITYYELKIYILGIMSFISIPSLSISKVIFYIFIIILFYLFIELFI